MDIASGYFTWKYLLTRAIIMQLDAPQLLYFTSGREAAKPNMCIARRVARSVTHASMGLLPDAYNCVLRMRRNTGNVFPPPTSKETAS